MQNILNAAAVIIMLLLIIWGFFAATTAEAWYVGSHDAQHEGPDCKCYERLVATDKEGLR